MKASHLVYTARSLQRFVLAFHLRGKLLCSVTLQLAKTGKPESNCGFPLGHQAGLIFNLYIPGMTILAFFF